MKQKEIENMLKDYSLTPKGLILISLGGYTGEKQGLRSFENTDKVLNGLTEYLKNNNCALIHIDGKLRFVPIDGGRKANWINTILEFFSFKKRI